MEAQIGEHYGNYQLLRRLGHGNFSQVYLGKHRELNSLAALKVLSIDFSPQSQERFLNEARLLSRLIHPHIIRILDIGTEKQHPYLVMDYAPGGTLREQHPKGTRLPLDQVINYVTQIAEALTFAHEHRILHRDLKPENILLSADGTLQLSDFGLATLLPENSASTLYPDTIALGGSLTYIAPEQLQGQPHLNSDQYALGIIVYEWLMGEPPFVGQVARMCYQHLMQPPPSLRSLLPDISFLVEQVILKALAKAPEHRFSSVADFAFALRLAAQGTTSPSLQAPPLEENAVTLPVFTRWDVLPTPLTSLIGRDQERTVLTYLLVRPEVRLLTLWGPGGVGKTRLALACAQEVRDAFADGVCFVSLTQITNPDLVLLTCMSALGIKEQGTTDARTLLVATLARRHLLLVLDNFEQVSEAASHLTELLASCPALTILVTSRAVLHVYGEQEFQVAPLPVPVPGRRVPPEQLARFPSITLFGERARAVIPSFHLSEANAEVITEIVSRVDGIPLALELAAARLRLLSLPELLTRLSHRLQILTGGSKDLPQHHQTLRKTIAWSYDLLSTGEQQLFRRLAIFVGGAPLSAIEYIVGELGEDTAEILDEVSSLLDQSLLYRSEAQQETRLYMLETIREFGLERLVDCGEFERVQRVHALYYARLAQELAPHIRGGAQQEYALNLLESNIENIRVMRNWLLDHDLEQAVDVEEGLPALWVARNHLYEDSLWLRELLARLSGGPELLKARAQAVATNIIQLLGDYQWVERLARESVQIFQKLSQAGEDKIEITALQQAKFTLGTAVMMRGGYEEAKRLFEESADENLQRGESGRQDYAVSLIRLSEVERLKGELATAQVLAEKSLRILRQVEYTHGIAYLLGLLTDIALDRGDYATAEALMKETTVLVERIGDKENKSTLLRCQAELLVAKLGELGEVQRLLEDSERTAREGGFQKEASRALHQLGQLALAQGQSNEARKWFEQLREVAEAMNGKVQQFHATLGLAHVALKERDLQEAQTWLSKARTLICAAPDAIVFLEAMGLLLAVQGNPRHTILQGAAAALRARLHLPIAPLELLAFSDQTMASSGEQLTDVQWSEGSRLLADLDEGEWQEASVLVERILAATTRSREKPRAAKVLPTTAVAVGLTKREFDVLYLLAQGLSNREIAERLVLSVVTVNSYLRSIYSKLSVTSRTQAVRYAIDHQLLL